MYLQKSHPHHQILLVCNTNRMKIHMHTDRLMARQSIVAFNYFRTNQMVEIYSNLIWFLKIEISIIKNLKTFFDVTCNEIFERVINSIEKSQLKKTKDILQDRAREIK